MDQKAYLLERYASLKALEVHKKSGKKKKKKAKEGNASKRAKTSVGGINIVDADAQWKPAGSDEDEDAPAVVEDAEVKRMMLKEEMRQQPFRSASSKDGGGWVEVTPDGSDRARQVLSPVRQGRHDSKDLSPPRAEPTSSRRVRQDSPDLSPPRGKPGPGTQARQESEDLSPPRQGGTRDLSPHRQGRSRHDSPDLSPPRTRHDSPDLSPPRTRHDSPDLRQGRIRQASPNLSPPRQGRTRHDSPDLSPPRQGRTRHDSPDLSPARQGRARQASPDMSPARARQDSADISPPRRGRARQASPDLSPPRARQRPLSRARNDSRDLSPATPPRQANLSPSRLAKTKDSSPPRRGWHDSPDLSPPRRARGKQGWSPPRRARDKQDLSPPRRARTKEPDSPPRRAKARNGSPDLSPPRRGRHDSPDLSPARGKQSEDLSPPRRGRPSSDLSPPRQPRGSQALPPLPPKRGGLQTAAQLKDEIGRHKEQEAQRFKELDPSITGRGAQTVYRKDGKKAAKVEEQAPKPPEKPLEWGKGLVQKRAAEAKQEEFEREMQKPFARSKDDPDLDKYLRNRIHWGDPMAHLVKRDDETLLEDLGQSEAMKESGFLVPQKIPDHSWLKRRLPAAPNRFDIRPGRHWDGIDRSNGFEQGLFKKQNEKKAQQEYAYRWSVEDM